MMTRKFSLESDFMNLTIDDMVYGYIQHMATFAPELNVLYVPIEKVIMEKKEIAKVINRTPRTVSNRINKLLDADLLKQEQIHMNGKDVLCYIIPQETKGRYQIIFDEMLYYLICTRNTDSIKIYLYLKNKYDWKKKTNECYSFTNAELLTAIGYANTYNNNANTRIQYILDSFMREGVIKWAEYYEINSCGKPTPKKRLLFIATGIKELNPIESNLQF